MTLRAQCLFNANLPRALLHGHKHDVHQANAGNAECERADEGQQHLQSNGDNGELMQLALQVGHEDGAMVRGAKVMGNRQRVAEIPFNHFVVASIIEPDAVQVGGVLKIAHG